MSPVRHTATWLMLGALMSVGCSFDTSAPSFGSGDGGFLSSDAAARSDGQTPIGPDASTVSGPDAAPVLAAGTLQSFSFTGSLELDGEVDAIWNEHDFVSFDIDQAGQYLKIPAYTPDAKLRFASRYDASKIYFFLEVTDDLLNTDSSNIYQDDSVEIYIDGLNDRTGVYGDDDHWLIVGEEGDYLSMGPGNLPLEGMILTTDVGYNIEISVQRSALGAAANATSFGFNVGINDDDDLGSTNVDAYGLWHLPTTPVCASCCVGQTTNFAWCDTTRLGLLQLVP